MKLYRVYRCYGENVLLDVVWANDEDDVYKHMLWERKDSPKLIIKEIVKKEGCVVSHHIADTNLARRLQNRGRFGM